MNLSHSSVVSYVHRRAAQHLRQLHGGGRISSGSWAYLHGFGHPSWLRSSRGM